MNIYAWIGVVGIVVLAWLPLLKNELRTKSAVVKAVLITLLGIAVVQAVSFSGMSLFNAMVTMVIVTFLIKVKWYTRKGLIILGSVAVVLFFAALYVYKEDPEYVLTHLEENPDSSSLVFMKNGDPLVAYQEDEQRPLASTVKIIIAIEYAEQVADGDIDPDEKIPLDEPDSFYLADTDGGAHPDWLEEMEAEERIEDGEVTLHDIAKGMITFSSNANTDYLLSVLGVENVNERLEQLGLTDHEPIYPLVSAILIPEEMQKGPWEEMDDDKLEKKLRNLSDEKYREKAMEIDGDIQSGDLQLADITYDESLQIQGVWSDRLPQATADDYHTLMAAINDEDTFNDDVDATLRELMEWPMEMENNRDQFAHLGSKGGSTAFVVTDATYAEDHDGNTFELVMFTDDLSLWQGFKLQHNYGKFKRNLLEYEYHQNKAQERLDGD